MSRRRWRNGPATRARTRPYSHKLHFWDLHSRKHSQGIDFGAENQLVFELRPAHDPTKAYGFVNSAISLKDLSASIWTWHHENGAWAVGKRVYFTNSLYGEIDNQFYPDGIDGWMVKLDAKPEGGMAFDPDFFIEWPKTHRPHQLRLEGGDCSSDSYCYP